MMETDLNLDDSNDSPPMDTDDPIIKRCRLLRKQPVQTKRFCAKDERNASLKKVFFLILNFNFRL